MSTPRILSRNIAAARESLGWSRNTLARRAGLCEVTVERLEAGYGDFPFTLASLEAIHIALQAAGFVVMNPDEQLAP